MRIIQILGDDIEELWQFPDDVTNEEIKNLYERYQNNEDYETFEDYINEYVPQMDGQRIFVDEIYV
jgi:hypothetical protein